MTGFKVLIIDFLKQLRDWFTRLPRMVKRLVFALLALFVLFLIIDLVFPVHTTIRYSQLILSDDYKLLNASLSSDQQWRMKAEIKEVNPLLIKTGGSGFIPA